MKPHSKKDCPYTHVKNCPGCGRSCSCYEKKGKVFWIATNAYGQMVVFLTLKSARKEGWGKEELIKTQEIGK